MGVCCVVAVLGVFVLGVAVLGVALLGLDLFGVFVFGVVALVPDGATKLFKHALSQATSFELGQESLGERRRGANNQKAGIPVKKGFVLFLYSQTSSRPVICCRHGSK